MVSPLNNWNLSKAAGESMERSFVRVMYTQFGLEATHENEIDKKKLDLNITCDADVKFLTAPYPSSPTPAGLTAHTHLTLDVANVTKYPANTLIFMVVDYRKAGVETCGLFWISAGKVVEIMEQQPKRVYSRSFRSNSDKVLKVAISRKSALRCCFRV